MAKLDTQVKETNQRADKWHDLTEKTFLFATYARAKFNDGSLQDRKEILMTLGQNPTLLDKKLHIKAENWLQPIFEEYPAVEAEFEKIRTTKYRSTKAKTAALATVHNTWLGR